MDAIRMFVSSGLGSCGFALLLNAPRRALPAAGLIGATGYLIYWLLLQTGWKDPMAMFAGCLAASLLAHLAARRMHMIATIFITAAIIPCVPGLGLYQCMSLLARGDSAAGLHTGISAMANIVMIALAIGLSAYLDRIFHKRA